MSKTVESQASALTRVSSSTEWHGTERLPGGRATTKHLLLEARAEAQSHADLSGGR
jgi:hypothetical protein